MVTETVLCPPGGEENPISDLEMLDEEFELPQYTPNDPTEMAVRVRNGFKYYGSKKNPYIVLDGMDMTVPKGVIYGLLGASGCGKTTLLSCILGQKSLHYGEIKVFGEPPNIKTDKSTAQVGYMPQEIALYGDFTVQETLLYFGWIAGMTTDEIYQRSQMLVDLMGIQQTKQRVNTLSGGEQRRVSLAATLLHKPQLLILDEPTVGVDTLLRETIWNYLKHVCMTEKTTIILTTHYIEEARQADIIALMRGGRLLAQEPPEDLIKRHEANSVEDVFLKLSTMQDQVFGDVDKMQDTASLRLSLTDINRSSEKPTTGVKKIMKHTHASMKKAVNYLPNFKANHIKALLWKNALWWLRNIAASIFMISLPLVILAIFWFSIGRDPTDFPIAVVNYETNVTQCDSTVTCNTTHLSCSYLERLKKLSLVPIYFDSEEEARKTVLHGTTTALITFSQNYTETLRVRINDYHKMKFYNMDYGDISVLRDVNDVVIGNLLKYRLFETFKTFAQDYLESCEVHSNILGLPISWQEPVHGVESRSYTNFVLSGMLTAVIFIMGILLTSSTMLIERSEASLERTLVMGVTETELLFAHILSEFAVLLIQSLIAVIAAYGIFDTTYKGSIFLVLLFTVTVGFCGMCYGILLSCVIDSEILVCFASQASFFSIFFLSGIAWPIEGMHYLFKPFTPFIPLTKPIESLRNILYKDWGLFAQGVFTGYATINTWTLLFLLISILYLKFKNF